MIRLKYLNQTCLAAPVQFEGEDFLGRPIYIRERHGELRVDYGEVGQEFPYPTILGPIICEEFATLDVIKEKTKYVLDWSQADVTEMPMDWPEPDEEYWNWLKK